MEIVNLSPPAKKPLLVKDLSFGDVYRTVSGCQETMLVVQIIERGSYGVASLSLDTSEVVYWNGHQTQACVRLKAKLEVTEEV